MTALKAVNREYVFFDVDDTLIAVKSMLSFQTFWYHQTGDEQGREAYEQDLREHLHPGASWEFLNRLYYRHFSGRRPRDVAEMGRAWFHKVRNGAEPFYHSRPLAELRAHQQAGREVVFVSGSFPALLDPIAEELEVRYVLSTRLEVRDGLYTGDIVPPQTIGSGKVNALEEFLRVQGGAPERCYAYGDDVSDFPMLRAVGQPTVVSGGRELEAKARAMGWRVIAPA